MKGSAIRTPELVFGAKRGIKMEGDYRKLGYTQRCGKITKKTQKMEGNR